MSAKLVGHFSNPHAAGHLSTQKTTTRKVRTLFCVVAALIAIAPIHAGSQVQTQANAGTPETVSTDLSQGADSTSSKPDKINPAPIRSAEAPHIARFHGTLTYLKGGEPAVIEDNGKSFLVEGATTNGLKVGDAVDAAGTESSHDFEPVLHDASLSATGQHQPLAPRAVSSAELISGHFDADLVTISGILVSQLHDTDSTSLVLNSDGHLISTFLNQQAPIEGYEVGSQLEISGICRVLPAGPGGAAHGSQVQMRDASDVKFIASPSWFSPVHILQLLVVLIIVGTAITVRATFLRWRSVHQMAWIDRTTSITRERTRILEMISSNHSIEELLKEICTTSGKLLPGTNCAFNVQLENELLSIDTRVKPRTGNEIKLFEGDLRVDSEQVFGKICITASKKAQNSADSAQIYTVVSELASLAMRQSLMYRGLIFHSTHDPLTELPNRRLFESRLATALKEAEKNTSQLALIYIDINRFKYVNDQFGHKTGDLYLKQISARLRNQLRTIDTLARVGGDEFVVIAPFPEGTDRVYSLTARLQACFNDPFSLDGVNIDGSASFGFARYPEHGLTADELTRLADHSMYIAKHESRISESTDSIAIITPDELELALLNGRYRLTYQPQFSSDGIMTGLEALLRLDDPVLGLVTPDAFISVAENHPVIVDIGAWVLRTALADGARWGLNRGAATTIAVNVSVRQLEEPGYARSVLSCLEEYGFAPERLELELIERSLMFKEDKVLQQLNQLRSAGVRIALDDFGTEESCLSLLHKLPIDTIKLDRSFIRAMDDEPTVLPIIRAIVSMAHSLGKRVIAEAIEHTGPVRQLMDMGEMDFQGYLLSRPMHPAQVDLEIRTWRSGIVMPDAFRRKAAVGAHSLRRA